MPKATAKTSGQRRQNKELSWSSSDDEDLIIDQPADSVPDAESSDKIENDTFESFKEMSEEEMAQHLKLCMKLSAENKINVKNAFNLRLIDILNKMVKNESESADLQQASLSLQASSKIYAGRVEALYQDTMKFHSHLQSIVLGDKKDKKKNPNMEDDVGDENEDPAENKKAKPKSKCKSFIKSEESLSMEQDVSTQATREPHANFRTINAAFSTSRFAARLLSSLRLSDDSCMLRCGISELCYKPRNPQTNEPYEVPPKLKGILGKIKNFNIAQSSVESLSESATKVSSDPFISTPKPTAPPPLFNDDDDEAFAAPDPIQDVPETPDIANDANSVESAIERFDVLNITADAFVSDISAAITDQGVDHRLLPPNSVLKKMLDRSKRSSIRPSTTGKSTKRKVKEPFFAGKSANDVRNLFIKGRSVTVSQKILSEWNIEKTSNIDLQYEFIEDLENRREYENSSPTLDEVLNVIKQNDSQYHFKYYFNKMSQIWKFSRRKLCVNESFVGTPGANQTERRVGSLAPTDPEALAVSFQNLSLHDSMHDICDSPRDSPFDTSNNDAPCIVDTDEAEFVLPPEPFETDIEDLMVKPPELVKPACMKYDKRPVNLNTEKIKDLLSAIITRRLEHNSHNENGTPYVYFSEVYEELKSKLEKEISEFISMQFTFVVLLILANQQTLLIANMNDDLSISKDVLEIENTDNI